MTEATETPNDELPIFPAKAPDSMADPAAALALLQPVLSALAEVVDPTEEQLTLPTPCEDFDVAALRAHALGWLQFFAAALGDPAGETERPDPSSWTLGDASGAEVVAQASANIAAAVQDGAWDAHVVMSQARMSGDAVVAMALGEYLVHGWDLATATGRPWPDFTVEAVPALEFLQATVQPEYRGPGSGFFDHEVSAPDDAGPLVRLLCFAGRHP